MISGSKNLASVFSMLHDGYISRWQYEDRLLELDIRIQYLAQRIDASFTTLTVCLSEVTGLSFLTWPMASEPPRTITEAVEIFRPQLDILGGHVSGESVLVTCNQPDPAFDYCGGTIALTAREMVVKDQQNRKYELAELQRICHEYWEDWKRSNMQKH